MQLKSPLMQSEKKRIKRIDPYADLPRAERRKILKVIRAGKLAGVIKKSVQRSIPYVEMLKDGVCRNAADCYSKTIEFGDTNYSHAKNEDKSRIIENWSKILNYFDDSVNVQLSFINQKINTEQYYKAIELESREDGLDALREEYVDILQTALSKGNKGIQKRRFMTITVRDENTEAALQKLERIEQHVTGELRGMKITTETQNGYQRLELMHDILNLGTDRKLNFNWSLIAKTGLTTKDFISPGSFDFRAKRHFGLENYYGRVSSLLITADELEDALLPDLLNIDGELVAALHFHSVDRQAALKMVKNQYNNIQQMQIRAQMKATSSGYSMDIMSPDLVTHSEETEDLLDDLKSKEERMFMVTFLLCNFADSEKEVENRFFVSKQIAQQYGFELMPLDWRQEDGLMGCLPIGTDLIKNNRVMTTSATAGFVPFTTCEIFQLGGIYYGVNSVSRNVILIDRKSLQNPNGLVLGIPGSGKSFATKCEMVAVLLTCADDILIVDPEREYASLVKAFGGQVIRISADSQDFINPMDINLFAKNEEDEKYDPVANKCEFITSFCEQVLYSGDGHGLGAFEKSIIDRCVIEIYRRFALDPRPENMPILEDLYNLLKEQPEPEATRLAVGLERYVTGSLNVFNHQTNVDINNRLVCFDTKDLGSQLKKLGMLVTQGQIWERVTVNRAEKKTTRYYVDEFHLLLQDEMTASSAAEMWKRFRKWGGIPTGITQNVSDFLRSSAIENIFNNSPFVMLLNQSAADQRILAKALDISEHQLSFVTNAHPGEGLIYFEGTIIPFNNKIPNDTELYKLMTTKFGE